MCKRLFFKTSLISSDPLKIADQENIRIISVLQRGVRNIPRNSEHEKGIECLRQHRLRDVQIRHSTGGPFHLFYVVKGRKSSSKSNSESQYIPQALHQ